MSLHCQMYARCGKTGSLTTVSCLFFIETAAARALEAPLLLLCYRDSGSGQTDGGRRPGDWTINASMISSSGSRSEIRPASQRVCFVKRPWTANLACGNRRL
ncbi:hypothetical protein C7974DRAFT_389855 [Boeremia exigua]|uniref:uncharacterized protein n=1 Tax=Boeremia exigua TaxID=749465 RepID=UPI001E8EE64A|nr:uncharacterized protein C7974DRAFT_389855 [Boeremia exigua]KAH6637608.1 hypothetical protein C7974DRAFT_389855 [Boeremia exigua]